MFGPLRNTWCMRFEGKNKQLKGYTTNYFKNIALCVSIQHQLSICYLLATRPGTSSSFLYGGDEVIGGEL